MPTGVCVADGVISAGAVTIPLEFTAMLLPFTSSASCPAAVTLSAAVVTEVHCANALATKALAEAFGRIGLRAPWSV